MKKLIAFISTLSFAQSLLFTALSCALHLFEAKQPTPPIDWRRNVTTLKTSVIFYSHAVYGIMATVIKRSLHLFKEISNALLNQFVTKYGLVAFASPNLAANFAPFILNHLADVAQDNAPQNKITPTGYLKCLIENDPMITMPEEEKLRLNKASGNIKQVRLSYLTRAVDSDTQTTDDCDNNVIPAYQDFILQAPLFRSTSFFIDDITLAQYMEEAAMTTQMGLPATDFMNEFYTTLKTRVSALLGTIDKDLIAQTVWGVNAATGLNTATALNIEKDATLFNLSSGWAKLLDQLDQNEVAGPPLVVGNGIFNQFMRSRSFQSSKLSGLNDDGYNDFKWYYDLKSKGAANWGQDNIGVFSKGSIGFVDLNKYVGFRTHQIGISNYGQLALPVNAAQNDGTAGIMKFDFQLRGIDCPTPVWNGYETVTVSRGFQLIVSKNFGLFQIPPGAYQASDSLFGNNGALLYSVTNNT